MFWQMVFVAVLGGDTVVAQTGPLTRDQLPITDEEFAAGVIASITYSQVHCPFRLDQEAAMALAEDARADATAFPLDAFWTYFDFVQTTDFTEEGKGSAFCKMSAELATQIGLVVTHLSE